MHLGPDNYMDKYCLCYFKKHYKAPKKPSLVNNTAIGQDQILLGVKSRGPAYSVFTEIKRVLADKIFKEPLSKNNEAAIASVIIPA